jgi:hypothetical protein
MGKWGGWAVGMKIGKKWEGAGEGIGGLYSRIDVIRKWKGKLELVERSVRVRERNWSKWGWK